MTSQLSELKAERIILLDRLALLGMGGTLFSSPSSQDSLPSTVTEADQISEEEAELAHITRLRRTPSKLAAYLTQKMARDAQKIDRGPSVAYIPDMSKITAALAQAEVAGRKQA